MNVNQLIDVSRRVKGAITLANVMDVLYPGTEVFILLNTKKNLAVIKGTVLFVQNGDLDDVHDVIITIEFRGNEKMVTQSLLLGGALNGRSAFIGDEDDSETNFNRIFTVMEDSIRYFEIVQFVREIRTLERTGNINSLISRLLLHQRKPKPD